MNFKPKKDAELNETYKQILLPVGEYNFIVTKATDCVSKNENEMIKLELSIHFIHVPGEGKTKVYDYLLESMPHKLKHFCEAVGLVAQYEAGSLTAELCKGLYGRCMIDIKVDKTGVYPDSNVVKDYCKRDINSSEIPF